MSPLRRAGIVVCVAVMVLAAISPALAQATGNVRDEFNSIGYAGNDGSLDWIGDWREAPLANGPDRGVIRVVNRNCSESSCLRVGPGNVTGHGVHREVDLTAAVSATLTFATRRQLEGSGTGSVYVAVSADGWQWSTVSEIAIAESDPDFVRHAVDLSAWSGSNVRIGFFGTGVIGGYVYIDDVEVSLSPNAAPSFSSPFPTRGDSEGDQVLLVPRVTDPDDVSLRFAVRGLPAGLGADPATGVVSGTIGYDAATASPYTTVITVTDHAGASRSESFVWVVGDTNRSPTIAIVDDRTVNELTPMQVTVLADDPDLPNDSIRYSLDTAPTGATVSQSGVVSWTPAEMDGPGTHQFTVRVEDDAIRAAAVTRSFDVHVAEVNSPPTLSAISHMALRAGDEVALALDVDDPDLPANILAFSATGLPPGTNIDAQNGTIGGSIPLDADLISGTAAVTVSDNGFPSAMTVQTFSWQIGNGNRPPVLGQIPDQDMRADGSVSFTASAVDADQGDELTYWLAAGIDPVPAGAAIAADTGEITWTPSEEQHDTVYRINVGVSDSGSPRLSATQLVTISVPEFNESPIVVAVPDQTAAEGDWISLQIDATDENSADTLRFRTGHLPPGLDLDPETGLITGELDYSAASESPYEVSVTVTDDGVPHRSTEIGFLWSVADTNRPPVADELEIVVLIGEPKAFALPSFDPDGDALEYVITDPPIFGTLEGDAPDLTYTGIGDRADGFTYGVSDGEFETEGRVSVEIRLSNEPPTATLDEYAVARDGVLVVTAPGVLANDTDPDHEPLSAQLVANPDHGEILLNPDGSFTYEPHADFVGADKFTYAAVDALDEQSATTVVLTVGQDEAVPVPTPSVEPPTRSAITGATGARWQLPSVAERSVVEGLRHGAGVVIRGAMETLSRVQFPLILLAGVMALMLAFGRLPLLGVGTDRTQGEGRIDTYDATDRRGWLVPDGGGEAVFIHGGSVGERARITSDQRVEFIAATIKGRRIALKVWSAT